MKNKDLMLRKICQKIFIELLSIENFSINYFSSNKIIRKTIMDFLGLNSYKPRITKNSLLKALNEMELENKTDAEILRSLKYKNLELIKYIYTDHYSLFSELSDENKKTIIAVDLCCNSILSDIFQSEKTSFFLEDFYLLMQNVLEISTEQFVLAMINGTCLGIADFNEAAQILNINDNFMRELSRLKTIPEMHRINLYDYETIGYGGTLPLAAHDFICFTGEDISSYVYSRLQENRTRFWYAKGLSAGLKLLDYCLKNKFYGDSIWIDEYEIDLEDRKTLLTYKAGMISFNVIVSGKDIPFEPDNNCVKISLKERLPENKPDTFPIFSEEEFIKRYGTPGESNIESPAVNARIKDIHRLLSKPGEYMKVDQSMYAKFNELMERHPNIINKDLLYAVMKISWIFAKENIVKIPPILFVGTPGCGKTLLCTEITQIIGQKHNILIPLGSGGGITRLLGSTPEYKGASNGLILSSIWEANDTINTLNSIVILDELDKACYSNQVSDQNQNILASLLQLLGDTNIKNFKDNFFEIELQNFYPCFLSTANSIKPIPESLLDRVNIIRLRDYNEQELKSIVIPLQYESFRNDFNNLIPEALSEEEIEIIYKLSKGMTRQIKPAIMKYLDAIFDMDGKRHPLSSMELYDLLKEATVNYEDKQIGFFR